jgi:hypothetical protein
MQQDPFYTVGSLLDEEKSTVRLQKILLLQELANIAANSSASVLMFDVRDPDAGHPFHGQGMEIVNTTLFNSSLAYNMSKVP